MKLISKHPPFYLCQGDTWYNERNKKTYQADTEKLGWVTEDEFIPFCKKTKVLKTQDN